MKQLYTFKPDTVKRMLYVFVAALLLVASAPVLLPGHAHAAQFSSRSIKLSDAGPSGGAITTGVGSGTGVTYRVTFTPTSAASSMVIDFCSQNPIINDSTCTTPTSMTFASGITNVSGTVGGTGWTLTGSNGQIKLADDGVSGHDIGAGITQSFDLTGITNPSTTGSFYARMYTFTNTTWGTYSSATSVGNIVDYGGIALSTASVITITARVQESLTFCVAKSDPETTWTTNHDCTDPVVAANYPALILGHGSPTAVLDANTVDTANVYSQISTNATSGAVIRIRNSNLTCGGLSADSGTTCAIPAIGTGSATPSAMVAGTAGFGLYAANGVADTHGTGGIGTLTANAAFHNGSHVTIPTDLWYGMNTTSGSGVTGTFGADLASTTAPCYRLNSTYVFAATSALTTPAGIYTANLSMIATGTF